MSRLYCVRRDNFCLEVVSCRRLRLAKLVRAGAAAARSAAGTDAAMDMYVGNERTCSIYDLVPSAFIWGLGMLRSEV
eukprot:6186828-Pleurochrysis_carterae.AAC.1